MKTLLVLEHEPSMMEFLRESLKPYHLIEAATAENALRLFVEQGRHVDLLLADLTQSTNSGLRVAFFLRSEIRDLPVILTSQYPVSSWSEEDYGDLNRLGSDSVAIIQKPFPVHVLSELVQALLGTEPSEVATTPGDNP